MRQFECSRFILRFLTLLACHFQAFRDRSDCANYNWYHCNLHVPQFSTAQGSSTCLSFRFLWFSLRRPQGRQSSLIPCEFFFTPGLTKCFSLSDSQSSNIFTVFLSIQTNFSCNVVRMLSIPPFISCWCRLFSGSYKLFQKLQLILISLSQYSSTFLYMSSFWRTFSFTLWSAGIAKFSSWQVIFLLLILTRFSFLVWIRWSVVIGNFTRLTFLNSFSFFYTPLISMWKLQILAQFSVDHRFNLYSF